MKTKSKPDTHKPTRETLKMHQAFMHYWELGEKRTLQKVGEKSGVSIATVKGWSSQFM